MTYGYPILGNLLQSPLTNQLLSWMISQASLDFDQRGQFFSHPEEAGWNWPGATGTKRSPWEQDAKRNGWWFNGNSTNTWNVVFFERSYFSHSK